MVGGFILTKVLKYSELTSSTLSNLIEYTLNRDTQAPPSNSIDSFLGGDSGIIKMARLEEDGTITPLGEKEFNSTEDFMSKIMSRALTPIEPRKIEDMSVEELNAEIIKALASQNYEDAAKYRDAIKNKKD